MIGLRLDRGLDDLALEPVAEHQHARRGDQREHHQPARDIGDHEQEQHEESHVDDQHDRGRSEEIAHDREIGHLGDEVAGHPLAHRQRRGEDLRIDLLRKLEVEIAADLVDHRGPRAAQRIVEPEGNQHADREHPQRRLGAVGDDPVVDVHREQRQRQREQVDHQRREQHRPELAAQLVQLGPEPVALRACFPRRAVLTQRGRIAEHRCHPPAIGRGEIGEGFPLRGAALGPPDQRIVVVEGMDHHQPLARQCDDRRVGVRPLDQLGGARRVAGQPEQFERGFGLVQRQRAVAVAREAREHRRSHRATKALGQLADARDQRVGGHGNEVRPVGHALYSSSLLVRPAHDAVQGIVRYSVSAGLGGP